MSKNWIAYYEKKIEETFDENEKAYWIFQLSKEIKHQKSL